MDGAVTAVEFGGRRFHCPHADLIPRHTGEERGRLDENGGFVYPVLLYRDTTLGLDDCVLDGHGRLGSAARTGAAVEFKHLGDMTTEEARTLAEHLEDDRRHETQDVVRARRERRIKRVVELRAEGMSTRAIAAEVGVSQPQVLRDLRESGDTGVSPDSVTGKDGKTYPTTRPAPEEAPDADAEESSGHDNDDHDDDLEFDSEEPEPLDATPPQPSIDLGGRPGRQPWMTGGNKQDPDHPFGDILYKFNALSAAITKAMASEKGKLLKQYLSHLSKHAYKIRMVLHSSDRIEGDEFKAGRAKFVGLYPLRKVIDKAGTRKTPMTDAEVAEFFRGVCGADEAEILSTECHE